jgi:ABC-type dipeptide/oligopeptide/nickel transport system permease component
MLAFVCRRLLATVPVLAMVAIFGFLVLRVHFMSVRQRWLRAPDLNLHTGLSYSSVCRLAAA